MAVPEVQQLQSRLDALEERMFGAPAGAASAAGPRKITDGLGKVQGALGNIASKRERVKILFKKIEDILKYLDPQYIDRMAMPDAMKLQFIMAEKQSIMAQGALLEQVKSLQPYLDSAHIKEKQSIMAQGALLEQVKSLQPYLDSAHIKASSDHATKLQRLSQIHLQQQDQCEAVTENIRLLLEDYNKMTLLLSKQFVQWDEMLSQLEAAKQVKATPE